MGAWNTGPFDNDDAGDFADDVGGDGIPAIRTALQVAVDADYLEAPEASHAVAAATFVAAVQAADLTLVPEDLRPVVLGLGRCPPGLPSLALQALAKVVNGSELDELWAESNDYDAWLGSISLLREKLA